MGRFRRKPEYVDAVQLTQEAVEAHVLDKVPLPDGCRLTSARAHPPTRTVQFAAVRLETPRLELVMPGDWIIRAAGGTLSVCRPDEFESMYEAADPAPRPVSIPRDEFCSRDGGCQLHPRGCPGAQPTTPQPVSIGPDDTALIDRALSWYANLGPDDAPRAEIARIRAELTGMAPSARLVAPVTDRFSPMVELAKWRRWATDITGGDGFQGDEQQRTALQEILTGRASS